MLTDTLGMQPHSVPRAMTEADIADTVREHATAAKLALEAGFDGVELHGANGYLIEQVLNPIINSRTDGYGGSIEGRNRLALEIARDGRGDWPRPRRYPALALWRVQRHRRVP